MKLYGFLLSAPEKNMFDWGENNIKILYFNKLSQSLEIRTTNMAPLSFGTEIMYCL